MWVARAGPDNSCQIIPPPSSKATSDGNLVIRFVFRASFDAATKENEFRLAFGFKIFGLG